MKKAISCASVRVAVKELQRDNWNVLARSFVERVTGYRSRVGFVDWKRFVVERLQLEED